MAADAMHAHAGAISPSPNGRDALAIDMADHRRDVLDETGMPQQCRCT